MGVLKNFWVEGTIDGRRSKIRDGPRKGSDGGFSIEIHVKDQGSSRKAVTVKGYPGHEGRLHIEVEHDGITEVLTFNDKEVKDRWM